jgi:hypothetical protein
VSRGWLVAGGLWTAVVLLAGAIGGWLWLASPELHEESAHLAFPTPGRLLRLDVDRGLVQVIAADTTTVSVDRRLEWTQRKPVVTEIGAADTLTLTGHCPDPQSWRSAFTTDCALRYIVRVPRSVTIEVTTSLADVQIRDSTAPVEVTTTTGNVTLANVRGPVRAHTGTGRVTGTDLTAATVDANTGSGAVDLTFGLPPRQVSAKTRTGDIRVAVPSGDRYRLLLSATSGRRNVLVDQDLNAAHGIGAETATGDILLAYATP